LVTIKAGKLADQCPFDFNDWDSQRCGVKHDLLQRGAPLWDNEQFNRLTPRGEGLLYWMATGDELLIWSDECERLHRDRAL
jgi:hypothetical protein